MTNHTANRDKRIYSQHGDAIRIVPLQLPDTIKTPPADAVPAPAAAPQLTYRNGPLIQAVEVFTLFWGPAWQTTQAALATQINGFFDFILTSPLIDQLAEYNVGSFTIGHGKRTGTTTITAPALKQSVSDSAIQHMLQTEISANAALPGPSPNTLYFIYLPPGVKVIQGGSASCTGFLWISQRYLRSDLLCGDALSGLQRVHRRPCPLRCTDLDVVPRAL